MNFEAPTLPPAENIPLGPLPGSQALVAVVVLNGFAHRLALGFNFWQKSREALI
jgi:hypothetical protein